MKVEVFVNEDISNIDFDSTKDFKIVNTPTEPTSYIVMGCIQTSIAVAVNLMVIW